MIRVLAQAIILIFSGVFAILADMPETQQTQIDFESMAGELPYLSISAVLHDRPEEALQGADSKVHKQQLRVLRQVTDRIYPEEQLLELLDHDDAKVRTLAAVALFDREDPTVLPSLARLHEDKASTFDGAPEMSATYLQRSGIGPPAKRQSVGDVITSMVSFYMERSGFYHGIEHKTQPGFTEYWNARQHRSHCAGWFAVQLARASQGTSPTPMSRIAHIRRLRERIDELPTYERTWTLLWLNGDPGSDALATEEELVGLCKATGPDKLLLMLQNRIPSEDPDLQPRASNNWLYRRMTLFVLRHADQVLRPGDSAFLLASERWHRDYREHGITDPTISPWWAVAAARLDPANAPRILHTAMGRFQGKHDADERATLAVALWQSSGNSERSFLANWFFEESPVRGAFPNCRGSFIEAMRTEADGQEVITHLIRDKRLDELDWQSLERLVRAVNAWRGTPIVTEEEIRDVRHPLGQGHYHWEKDKARRDWPKETEELEKHLDDWRRQLRSSLPD